METHDGLAQINCSLRCLAAIELGEIGAPGFKCGVAAFAGAHAVIGDIVHRAAEGIDRVHRLALGLRQNAHRRIERASGGFLLHRLDFGWSICQVGVGDHGWAAICEGAFLGRRRRTRKRAVVRSASPSASGLEWWTRSDSGSRAKSR